MAEFYGKVYRYADGVLGVKQVTENPIMSFGVVYKKYTKPRASGEIMHSDQGAWTAEEAQAKLDIFAQAHELPEAESMCNQEKTERDGTHKAIEWRESKYFVIVDSDGNPVATTHRNLDVYSPSEYMRNVRIIAAAPDMLRILRSMCNKLLTAKDTKDVQEEILEAERLSEWIAICEFD